LVTVRGVDDVLIERFRLRAPTTAPCLPVYHMVLITNESHRAKVRSNEMAPEGSETTGPCGYVDGVMVNDGSSSRIANNLIQDFRSVAVQLNGRKATVLDNTLAFLHAEGDHGDVVGFGIASQGANDGLIEGNDIYSGRGSGPGSTPRLNVGIQVATDVKGGTVVRDNRVRGAYAALQVLSDGVVARQNILRRGGFGLMPGGSSGHRIVGNRVSGFAYGTYVTDPSSGILFRENDFRGNGLDCYDDTNGDSPETANIWMENLGDSDYKDGICTPAP
jgi:hypothetical protein